MNLDRQTALRQLALLVRNRRNQLRLDRDALARKVGVGRDIINRVEHGEAHRVDKMVLLRVVKGLCLPAEKQTEVHRLMIPIMPIPVGSGFIFPVRVHSNGRQLRRL